MASLQPKCQHICVTHVWQQLCIERAATIQSGLKRALLGTEKSRETLQWIYSVHSLHIFHILCHASCHRCNMMMYCNMMQLGCVIVIHRCDKVQCWCQNNPIRISYLFVLLREFHFASEDVVAILNRRHLCTSKFTWICMDLPHVAMCKASRPGKKGLPPNMLIVSQGYQSFGQFSVVNTMVSLVFEETEGEIQNRKLKKCQTVCCNCRAKDLPLSLLLCLLWRHSM